METLVVYPAKDIPKKNILKRISDHEQPLYLEAETRALRNALWVALYLLRTRRPTLANIDQQLVRILAEIDREILEFDQ